jgi:hypothetical protein
MSRHGTRRAVVAILAAYALLWQAFLGCVTSADWLVPANLALSAAICATDRDVPAHPSSPQRHDHAGCCVLCVTPGLAWSDSVASTIAPLRTGVILRTVLFDVAAAAPTLAGHPCQPRAPPAFA